MVGETGVIEADIRSQTVIVSGTIHGNVRRRASASCCTRPRACRATSRRRAWSIEEGAVLNGKLNMASAGPKKPLQLKAMDGGVGEKPKGLIEK